MTSCLWEGELSFRTPSDVCMVHWCQASALVCYHRSRVLLSLQRCSQLQQHSAPSHTEQRMRCTVAAHPPCWCCCGTACLCLWPFLPAWPEGQSANSREGPTLTPSSQNPTRSAAGSTAWTLDRARTQLFYHLWRDSQGSRRSLFRSKKKVKKFTDPSWVGCHLWLLWRSRCRSPSLFQSESTDKSRNVKYSKNYVLSPRCCIMCNTYKVKIRKGPTHTSVNQYIHYFVFLN